MTYDQLIHLIHLECARCDHPTRVRFARVEAEDHGRPTSHPGHWNGGLPTPSSELGEMLNIPWGHDDVDVNRFFRLRKRGGYDIWRCGALPHQFAAWWGNDKQSAWIMMQDSIAIYEVDVEDALFLMSQVCFVAAEAKLIRRIRYVNE